MDHDVALWQREIYQGDEQQESGPVAQLFRATVATFSALLQIIADDPGRYTDGSTFYNTLQDEFQKFYMWNEGFSSSSGQLDVVLSCSKNLRATVLDLMVHWAKVVCRIPRVLAGYSWSGAQKEFAELEVLAEKIGQVVDATTKDLNAQYYLRSLTDESDSDANSDSSSFMSVDNFEDIVEDMKVYSESLIDLTPSLETPASDFSAVERSTITPEDDLLSVSEPARPFVLIIKDRFPSMDAALVKKLGEANWQRRERLGIKLAHSRRMSTLSSSDSGTFSANGTIVDPARRQAIGNRPPQASIIRSSMSFASNYQSIITASNFSEPSIFDRHSTHIPMNQQRRSIAESFTSFATSIGEEGDNGRRRFPRLLSSHDFNSQFQCKICGDIRRDISNAADWKKHVYDDLEPYICLFTDCALRLNTFQSQKEWMIHEFTFHRTEVSWRCNLCADIFLAEQELWAHISNSHKLHFMSSHISEVITASKRTEMRDGTNEVCPFCLVVPAQSQKAFARHVGRHLQEISLAALPITNTFPDSDSDGDNIDDDDDDNSNEELLLVQPDKGHDTVNGYLQSTGPPAVKRTDITQYLGDIPTSLENVTEDGFEDVLDDSGTAGDEPGLVCPASPTLLYERDIGSIGRDSMFLVLADSRRTENSKAKNFSLPLNDTPDVLAFDHENDIRYDTDVKHPTIKGGTLQALVEQLTRHDRLDSAFNSTFLLTYRSFTTARELFELLLKRFHIQPKGIVSADIYAIWRDKKQKPIRFRVVNVLKLWLDNHWKEDQSEATTKLIMDIYTFAKDTVKSTMTPGLGPLMAVLERRLEGQEGEVRQLVLATKQLSIPSPILPKNLKKIRLLDVDVIEFARQLTVLDSKLYSKIKPIECLDKTWERKIRDAKAEPALNVKAHIFHSNQLTNWVVGMILSQEDVKKRVLVINHFITIADKCRILNNYSSLMSIISAFGAVAIHRLKLTWDQVPTRNLTVLEQLRKLMGSTKNFAEYRDSLHLANPPCVPFLGVFLADLAYIEDRIPSIVEKCALINFAKYTKIAEVILDIQQYQNIPYPLRPVPELQEYILSNMQAASDLDEMYDKSLMVEPREREDLKIARVLAESGFL